MILKSLFILFIGLAIRVDDNYFYSSILAWSSFIYAVVWLDEDKPWRYSYFMLTAHSSLYSYCVLAYLIGFHVVILL